MKTYRIEVGAPDPGRAHDVECTPWFDQWWSKWGSPDMRALYLKFGIGIFRRSTALLGLDRLIRENNVRGKRCVEIGTACGMTAIILSRHFDEVVTIDIEPNDKKAMYAEACGVRNIRFVDCQNGAKAELINSLDFDAAYSDGDHSKDTEADFALVKRCGRVLFHEYWPLQPPVWNLVNQLRDQGTVTVHDNFALWVAK